MGRRLPLSANVIESWRDATTKQKFQILFTKTRLVSGFSLATISFSNPTESIDARYQPYPKKEKQDFRLHNYSCFIEPVSSRSADLPRRHAVGNHRTNKLFFDPALASVNSLTLTCSCHLLPFESLAQFAVILVAEVT